MFAEVKGNKLLERLRHLNLWTLEERRNKQDLIQVFKMYKGFTKMDISTLFTKDSNVKDTRRRQSHIEVEDTYQPY